MTRSHRPRIICPSLSQGLGEVDEYCIHEIETNILLIKPDVFSRVVLAPRGHQFVSAFETAMLWSWLGEESM